MCFYVCVCGKKFFPKAIFEEHYEVKFKEAPRVGVLVVAVSWKGGGELVAWPRAGTAVGWMFLGAEWPDLRGYLLERGGW